MDSKVNEQILKGIFELSATSDAFTIVRRFGQRIMDQRDFRAMVRSYNTQITDQQIDNFYYLTLQEFQVQGITVMVMDQLVKRAKKNTYVKVTNRSPEEIMNGIQKILKLKNTDIERVFRVFDQDRDNILNEKEFRSLIDYYVVQVSNEEYQKLRIRYNTKNITLYDLMSWLQEGSAMHNSIKMGQAKQPQIQAQGQKQIIQAPIIKAPLAKQQPRINPILESNIYEDPKYADILKSDINFEQVIQLDYNLVGVQDFLSNYTQLFKQQKQYTDQQFPPNQKSLGNMVKNYEFKRLSQIWPDHKIFKKATTESRFGIGKWIDPKDIQQGELGDCYFLSALSSIACRWPEVILKLFLTQTVNPCAMYAMRLCIDGQWEAIVVDDYVPCQGNRPAFSQSESNESWVILLEKAWAKAFGSYSNIISGISMEVLRSITGGPTWTLNTDQEDFKVQFIGCIQRKCVMTVGTYRSDKNYAKNGLIAGHAYSILKLKDIGNIQLVKLRNPWAKQEWNGDWSDQSPKWTQELKQQFKVNSKEDGIFFMSLADFMQLFQTISVGYFKENYHYQSQSYVCKRNKSLYFSFGIVTEGEYYITVIQKSERHYKDKFANYRSSPIRLVLGQQIKNGYTFEDSKNSQDQACHVGGLLDKGRYFLQVKINWIFQEQCDFRISSYGQEPLKLRPMQKDPIFIDQVLMDRARQQQLTPFKECTEIQKCHEIKMEMGMGYFYFTNQSNKTLDLSAMFTVMEGLKLKKPYRNNQYQVVVPPKSEKIVTLSVKPDSFNMNFKMQYLIK